MLYLCSTEIKQQTNTLNFTTMTIKILSIEKETEKAINATFETVQEYAGQITTASTVAVWFPKSVVNNEGIVADWFITKNRKERTFMGNILNGWS